MPKSLRTFLDDMRREAPEEVVQVTERLNPSRQEVTALIHHLKELRKFPILVFDHPLNLHGQVSDIKLVMNCEASMRKIQVALGVSRQTDRVELALECLRREEQRIEPTIVDGSKAPVKEVIQTGAEVDLFKLPIMRHHAMDGGPYLDMSSVGRDREAWRRERWWRRRWRS